MKSVLLAGFFAFLGLVLAFDWHTRRADPVIEGKRMGVWALNLVREPYGRDEYRIRLEYMRVFKMDREAAISALMKAVAKHYSKGGFSGPALHNSCRNGWMPRFVPKQRIQAIAGPVCSL